MLKAEGVGYVYRGEGGVRALSGVTFSLAAGACLGVAGGPGAGKSTLARMVAGIHAPSEGRLAVCGVTATADRFPGSGISARVGYLPQWPERQLFARTVAEDVAAGIRAGTARGTAREDLAPAADEALASVGLDAGLVRDRPVFALSGAEARKVALAGVLVLKRPVLVLDEPTAGMDHASRREMVRLMAALKEAGSTLVVVSHRLDDLVGVADRLLVLEAGRAVFQAGLEEALAAEDLPGAGLPWPPVVELLRRLRRRHPSIGLRPSTPAEAFREILRVRGGQSPDSPKTCAS